MLSSYRTEKNKIGYYSRSSSIQKAKTTVDLRFYIFILMALWDLLVENFQNRIERLKINFSGYTQFACTLFYKLFFEIFKKIIHGIYVLRVLELQLGKTFFLFKAYVPTTI